jgi:hypothetical protein
MTDVTPANGTVFVTATTNLRANTPNESATLVGQIRALSTLTVTGIAQGQSIDQNTQWYQIVNNIYVWSGACSPLQSA